MENQILQQILGELQNMNSRFDRLETDVTEIKTDITGLKSDVVEIRTDITGLKSDVANLQQSLTETKHRVIIIEDEHSKKLGALLDGYDLLYKMAQKMDKNIEIIKEKQEEHDINIKWLDTRVKKTS